MMNVLVVSSQQLLFLLFYYADIVSWNIWKNKANVATNFLFHILLIRRMLNGQILLFF